MTKKRGSDLVFFLPKLIPDNIRIFDGHSNCPCFISMQRAVNTLRLAASPQYRRTPDIGLLTVKYGLSVNRQPISRSWGEAIGYLVDDQMLFPFSRMSAA